MSEDWGPWVEHDGKHMPPDGSVVQALFDDHEVLVGVVDRCNQSHRDAFLWALFPEVSHVIRYRIRTPRALAQLRAIAAAPEREEVPA